MKKEELTEMITLYGNDIYAFCYRITGDRDQADELYQDVFLKAIEICHKIDRTNNPKCYLIGIANRLWKNKQKKYANRKRIAPMQQITYETEEVLMGRGEICVPEKVILKNECERFILASISNLEDKLRISIIMYYMSELAIKEIAELLKVPVGTIKTRLHKGRELIKGELKEMGYEK